ncbi:MAG: 30S ribosomal protein THX [Bacteroidetes bacterium]|nr:30S ribosomal protein THX [Bacteroidota bacterium]
MGKGDIKSKRGKIVNGSYGVSRKKKSTKKYVAVAKPEVKAKAEPKAKAVVEEVAEVVEKKVAAKKAPKKVKEETAE